MKIVKHPTLYHRGSGGEIREWYMEVQFDAFSAAYRTVSGVQGGKMVESGWKIVRGKGVGKAATTPHQQAEREIASQYVKKQETKYHADINNIDTVEIKFDVMLADKYKEFPGPCSSQPKLDGIRCVTTRNAMESRGGKPLPGAPHVASALERFFECHPTARLDGELYNHTYKDDFNTIVSAVKKATKDPVLVQRARMVVQYHVYDVPSHPGTFKERWEWLQAELFAHLNEDEADVIKAVETVHVESLTELDELYGRWLEEGYEGQMVRLDTPYENRRTKALLKRKEFVDEEFPLISINEGQGNWAGVAKSVTVQLPNGKQCNAGIKGSRERAKDLLNERYQMVTVRYQNLTPDGVPRFPVAIKFWDKEAVSLGDRDETIMNNLSGFME